MLRPTGQLAAGVEEPLDRQAEADQHRDQADPVAEGVALVDVHPERTAAAGVARNHE